MEKNEIIKSIGSRTNGDIYLGVVGAVRTGKSTFIKKFIETLVLPNIEDEYEKKRCLDEMPQSAQGKTIMTTEPKFVPSNAAKINIEDFSCNIRLVDCVGYVIEGAKGYEDENGPRMVKTPWYDEQIPFVEAAEIGTEKVIRDHSTIGIVVTTDGSIGEIERKNYEAKEEEVKAPTTNELLTEIITLLKEMIERNLELEVFLKEKGISKKNFSIVYNYFEENYPKLYQKIFYQRNKEKQMKILNQVYLGCQILSREEKNIELSQQFLKEYSLDELKNTELYDLLVDKNLIKDEIKNKKLKKTLQ